MSDKDMSNLLPLPKELLRIDMSDDETWGEIQEHAYDSDHARDLVLNAPLFTAGQMHAYAKAARSHSAQSNDQTQEINSLKARLADMCREYELLASAQSAQSQEAQPEEFSVMCPHCHGNGLDPLDSNYKCKECDGTGFVSRLLYTAQPAGVPESHSAQAGSEPADAVAEYADYMKAADLAGEHPHSPDAFDSIKAFLLSNKQPAQQAPVSAMTEEELHSAACDFLDRLRADAEFQMTCMDGTTNIVGVIKAAWKDSALLSTAHSSDMKASAFLSTVMPGFCATVSSMIEMAADYVGNGHKSTILADQLRRIIKLAGQPSSLPQQVEDKRPDLFKAEKLVPYEIRYFETEGMAERLGYKVLKTYTALSAQEKGGE